MFEKADGTFVEDTLDCDGTSSTIVSNLYCTVPMATVASTTGLAVDALV